MSRATGVARVLVIGAVLGPTFFGNAFQVTNSLPNLIYFGFLAGSLFTSLIVPALVGHVDARDVRRAAELSGGFLGVAWLVLLVLVPLAVLVLPELLHVVWSSDGHRLGSDEERQVRLLVLLTAPQAFLYAVVGSAAAAMNAHRRFALASAAPAVENAGVIAVLLATALAYGDHPGEVVSQPLGKVLLLGLGSTGAVAVHAGLQWWGAHRNGVTLRPRRGWRDPEVVQLICRSRNAVAQAGLHALQVLVILVLAGRVSGGSVAMQIGFNFYYLPVALVATPVGLAMLPRLSRLHQQGSTAEFSHEFIAGLRMALFLAVPAAVGYVVLAQPLAHVIAAGEMGSASGLLMTAQAIAALAPGLVGQTVFFVSVQAAYAGGDTRTPLGSMALQAVVCLLLATSALFVRDSLIPLLGLSYAAASLIGGAHLLLRVTRTSRSSLRPLLASTLRVSLGSCLMALAAWLVAGAMASPDAERLVWIAALLCGCVAGLATYLTSQSILRSPEWSSLRSAVRRRGPLTSPAGSHR